MKVNCCPAIFILSVFTLQLLRAAPPEADKPAIFDRFFRAHAHLDQELGVSGTGLGLAIVVDCVQALGGNIHCESRPGEGTAFFIILPVTN